MFQLTNILNLLLPWFLFPRVWGTATVVGVSVLGGLMGKKASKKQAEAERKRAEAIKKIAYKRAAFVEEGAARGLKLAGHNQRLMEIEAEDTVYRGRINQAILSNNKQELVNTVTLEKEKVTKESLENIGKMKVVAAANNMDVNSVSMQAILIDNAVETNQQLATLSYQQRLGETEILTEKAFLSYEVEQAEARNQLDRAFMQDEAEFAYTSTMREADFIRMEGDAALSTGQANAAAAISRGNAQLVSSLGSGLAMTAGSKEFRTDFSKKFS